MGRLCHSVTEQCPNLKLVMQGGEPAEKPRGTPRYVCLQGGGRGLKESVRVGSKCI